MKAHAKINLALVVGPVRADGMHEVVTVLQRIGLHDDVSVAPADELVVTGFEDDTIVADALEALARTAEVAPRWRATIEKRIPVAAGLGGGSSDAAAALALANDLLDSPLAPAELQAVAAKVGADVPFFLAQGAQLATGTGTELAPLALPLDYDVVVVLPDGVAKESTGDVYARFDRRNGADGFAARAARLHSALAGIADARDLAQLPANDLMSSPTAQELLEVGAFRADVSGAGPAVYGLFLEHADAQRAARVLRDVGDAFVARPL
jgi:4-diphosphocytidyl-2-C-methyl-D-erythritol kinase